MGSLEVICGSMFSGKSEELIRRVKRVKIAKKEVVVFKPAIDTRYNEKAVNSHDGNSVQAHPLSLEAVGELPEMEIVKRAHVVAIDEAQFFPEAIVDTVHKLIEQGKRVIISGLDLDFAGRPFGSMPVLMALADEVTKLKAICVKCGRPAFHTQRIIDGRPASKRDPLIVIGGQERYEARCRDCYELRG